MCYITSVLDRLVCLCSVFDGRLLSQHDICLMQALTHDPLYGDLLEKVSQSSALQEKLMARTSTLQVVLVIVTTCMENLARVFFTRLEHMKMSGILTAVGEMLGILLKSHGSVSENILSGKTCLNCLLLAAYCRVCAFYFGFGSCTVAYLPWLAVWLSGNMLASINVRQTRLVLGWVTVCGRVNHFGM